MNTQTVLINRKKFGMAMKKSRNVSRFYGESCLHGWRSGFRDEFERTMWSEKFVVAAQ